jgi:uncharacterized protein YndB with AHSA1/START domain
METHTEGRSAGERIEMKTQLKASRSRVWRAISDPQELGAWFGLRAEGPFVPGARVTGTIVPTTVDADVAKQQRQFEGTKFELLIERVEPERLFSFRWHPFAVERGFDYEAEPTTLVSLSLDDARDGVTLTVRESGFERLPAKRRAEAFAANQQGWATQLELIRKYLARS